VLSDPAAPPGRDGGVFWRVILRAHRALAEQVVTSIRAYGRHTHLKGAAVLRRRRDGAETRALKPGADIVVATPGRLLDHMERGHVNFSKLEVLVPMRPTGCSTGVAPDVRKI